MRFPVLHAARVLLPAAALLLSSCVGDAPGDASGGAGQGADDGTSDDGTSDGGTSDGGTSGTDTGGDTADTPMEKQVLAFYYPWYRTPEHSGSWWHWNEEGHDPDTYVSEGRRDIASKNYPAIDVYDSLDPDVIDLHIQQSVEAGIDAWIISWWGDDEEITAILDRIEALDSPLKVTAYYERVPGCSTSLCTELTAEEKTAAASSDLLALLGSLSDHPAWLTVDDEPVVFVYIRAMGHGLHSWDAIIEEVEATRPLFISGDASLTVLWQYVSEAFDQVHVYNPTGQIDALGEDSLAYADFCAGARTRAQSCSVTVIPGYDDSVLPSRDPIVLDREGGALYERLWEASIAAAPDWVLITSFNEWHEGSEIEPSLEYGEAYLEATAAQAAAFEAGGD